MYSQGRGSHDAYPSALQAASFSDETWKLYAQSSLRFLTCNGTQRIKDNVKQVLDTVGAQNIAIMAGTLVDINEIYALKVH